MKRFDIGRLFALLCLVLLPLVAVADTVKIGDGITGRPLDTTDGVPTRPGTILPAEIEALNRYAWINHDSCTVLAAAATTTLKTGAGNFARINFMSGTTVKVTAYDNTAASGTLLYDNSAVGVTPAVGFLPPTVHVGGAFSTGLTVVVAGTNPVVGICFL